LINAPPPTEPYTLSLHDALPIWIEYSWSPLQSTPDDAALVPQRPESPQVGGTQQRQILRDKDRLAGSAGQPGFHRRFPPSALARSEERRVGKEGGSRGARSRDVK